MLCPYRSILEYPDTAVGILAVGMRDELRLARHIVLQAADDGIGGGQIHEALPVHHRVDGGLGLQRGGFIIRRFTARRRQIEELGERLFHLGDRVGAQDVDRNPARFGIQDGLLATAVIGAQGDQHFGFLGCARYDRGHAQALGSLDQAVARHAVGIDMDGLQADGLELHAVRRW